MTRIFRFGLVTEVVLNVGGAFAFVAWPERCLGALVAAPPGAGGVVVAVAPLAALLFQLYGALVLALSVPLVLCLPDRQPAVYEKRRIVFTTLAAGEIAMVALFLRHALAPAAAAPALPPRALLTVVAFLLPALAWHCFALFARPRLMQPLAAAPPSEGKKKQ